MSWHTSMNVLYLFIFIKQFIFSEVFYYDFQFIASTIIMLMLSTSNDIIKYILHILYLCTCVSLVIEIMDFIYGIIFYFGFAPTIIFLIICAMTIMGRIHESIFDHVTKINSVGILASKCQTLYLEYVGTNIQEILCDNFKLLFENLIHFLKKIAYELILINRQFSTNSRSRRVCDSVNQKIDALKMSMFNIFLQKFQQHTTNFQYKNNFNIFENMSFLENTKLNSGDVLDDLDDEQTDNQTINKTQSGLVPQNEGIISSSSTESERTDTGSENKKPKNRGERRAEERRKMAEEKAKNRGQIKTANPINQINQINPQDITEMMNNPQTMKMMQSMLKQNGLGMNMSKIQSQLQADPAQLQKVIQSLNKMKN